MDLVTFTQVETAIRESNIRTWSPRSCGMCCGPLKYVFRGDQVFYDSNCYCVSYVEPMQPRSVHSLVEHFNMQTPEVRQAQWDSFMAACKRGR